MEEIIRATINIDRSKWERFKKIAKLKNSDASKEVRKFVDRYLVENVQLLLEAEAKKGEKR